MGANTKKMLIGVVAAIVVLLGLLIVLFLTDVIAPCFLNGMDTV